MNKVCFMCGGSGQGGFDMNGNSIVCVACSGTGGVDHNG